jgi:hypothetical protein
MGNLEQRPDHGLCAGLLAVQLSGTKLSGLLESIKKHNSPTFTKLTLNENVMGTADLAATTEALAGLHNLRSLSIGGNFDRKDNKMPAAFARLLEIPKVFLGEALMRC